MARSSRTARSRSRDPPPTRRPCRGVRRVHAAAGRGPAGRPSPRRRGKGAKVGPKTVKVDADGSFETPLGLSTGKWQLTVTATSPEGKSTTLTRDISIRYKGVTLVVEIKDGPRLDQGLGRRQGLEGHRHGRQGLQPGQGPDVHGQAGDRGPHGQVERDVLHAQRQGPRPDVEQGQPRDLAVRAAGQADPHRTATDGGRPAGRARRAAPGPVRRAGAHGRHRRVVHRRARRPRCSPRCPARPATCGAGSSPTANDVKAALLGRAAGGPRRARRGLRAGRRGDGRGRARAPRTPTSASA